VKQDVTTSEIIDREYQAGFVTDIESEKIPAGLSEDVVRLISTKKNEPQWLLDWRLKAYRHWLTMTEPSWQNVHYPPIDYQSIVYYSAPQAEEERPEEPGRGRSQAARDLREARGALHERARLAGVAVDAVFDSVSVATTFRAKLEEVGVIFCSFSEACRTIPSS
jgi:Fe-S cluster assembly protein SufB